MSLDKISNLKDWDISSLPAETLADVAISFRYPAIDDELLLLEPKQRVQYIEDVMRQSIETVAAQCSPVSSGPPGRHPRGMNCSLSLHKLASLCSIEQVQLVRITSIAGAKKARSRTRKTKQFFCVKMTAVIQIEGAGSGLQGYEERYVLIRAASSKEACNKVEASKSEYGNPYLNSDGYLVRWKIESLDDCYETGITALSEFNNPEGVEVFSIIKRRRMTPERVWDGKAE